MGFRLSRDLAFSALPSAGERSGVRPAGAGVNDATSIGAPALIVGGVAVGIGKAAPETSAGTLDIPAKATVATAKRIAERERTVDTKRNFSS